MEVEELPCGEIGALHLERLHVLATFHFHLQLSMCQEPPHGEIRALLHNYVQRPNVLATLHRQLQFSRPPETLKTADGDGGRGTTLWRN